MLDVLNTLKSSFSPLKLPNFRIYLGGQAISLIGTWLQSTAQGWVVWELSRSEAALGVVNMFATLPILLIGPWAGVWADRLDRRKLLIGTQFCAMLLAFVLALLVQTETVQLWHVFALSLGLGIVATLDLPAQQAFLGDLTGMGEIRKAVNLNAMILQVSRVLGPATAGFLVARLGAAPAFWLNGLSFLAVILSLLAVRSSQVRAPASSESPLRQLMDSVRYIRTQPRLQDLFLFAAMMTFFALSVILNLLPAVADTILGGDAATLGTLMASSGAGALTGVVLVVPLAQSLRRSGIVMGVAAVWLSLCLLIFAFSRSLPLSMLCLYMAGLGAPTIMTMALGLTQLMSPPDMRARLLSLFTMVSFGLQPLAALLVGFIGEHFGVQTAIELNAIGLFTGVLLLLWLRPGLRAWEVKSVPRPPAPVSEAI
ncbi:MAG: MFS transporter [Anaerolineae bacterium]|jgi:MFS family permease|nr:MFS transporter [Anaerolineae bacterium]